MTDVDDIINHWRNLRIIWADEPIKKIEIAHMQRVVNYCDALKARVEELSACLRETLAVATQNEEGDFADRARVVLTSKEPENVE